MGMYTDLICTAIIKEEYRDRIHKVVFESDMFEYKNSWSDLFKEEWAEEFIENERADMIPFGENNLKEEEIFDGVKLHIECSIKNYEYTYEAFYEFLKEISDEIIEFKTYFEECYDYTDDGYVYRWFNYLTNKYEDVFSKDK